MPHSEDPTQPIRERAASFPGVAEGTSCNQSSFRVGKAAFLFIGPGAKGIGFKAMFKLDRSMPKARELATERPDRFEAGSTGWVTTRFTAEKPLPKSIWEKWLKESFEICSGANAGKKTVKKKAATSLAKKTTKVTKKKTARKKTTKKKTRTKKAN